MTRLTALKRSHFEAAMRAVRRVLRGMQRAVDDPTVAYVDIVAALESLSEGVKHSSSLLGPTGRAKAKTD